MVKKKRAVKKRRTPAQIRATNKLVRFNKARARQNNRSQISGIRKKKRTTKRRSNPIRYVIQGINVRTGDQGWFTGDSIDSDIKKARTYKDSRGATLVAKQLFKVLPSTWRLMVVHEHRPR